MRSMLVFLFPIWSLAQVSFDVQPREIGINEYVNFTIRVEGGNGGKSPDFSPRFEGGAFVLLSSAPSVQHATSIVNGSYSTSETFTYTLKPKQKGKLKFPQQSVVIEGQTYRSPAVDITVGDENTSISRGRDPFENIFRRRRSREPRTPAEIFVEMEVPKQEFYLGEAIPLKINIIKTRGVNIRNQGSSMNIPDFQGFWVEESETSAREKSIVRDGKSYREVTVDQRRLFANKSGPAVIEPVELTLVVAVSSSFLADWQKVNRSSDPITLNIKPLPEAGKPADFEGAVGSFQVSNSLDKSELKVGESASLTVKVTGDGNFSAIRNMALEGLDRDFEIFDGGAPTIEKKDGRINSKTWVFALVPKREGQFQIKMPELAFFDLSSETYRSDGGEVVELIVNPGLGLGQPVNERVDKNRFMSEQNLSFIKLGELGKIDARLAMTHPRLLVQVVAGFCVLDFLIFLGLFLRNRAMENQKNHRPKFAIKNFRKALSKIKGESGDADRFFAGLSQAVLDYFGDKWDRQGQGISLEIIRDRFERDGIDATLIDEVTECVEALDLARFTPTTSDSRESLLEKAKDTVEKVEGALS